MSSWLDLGTIEVSRNWDIFPVPGVGGDIFRLTQISSDFDELRRSKGGVLYFKDFFSVSAVNSSLNFTKVSIGDEARIVSWPIPQELEAKGIAVREFYIRRWVYYGRLLMQENATLKIKLEQMV